MDQKRAMDLLQIAADTSLEEAEARYRSCCDQLRERYNSQPPDLAAQQVLDVRLDELSSAIEYLRRPRSSVERAGAAMLANFAREAAPAVAPVVQSEPDCIARVEACDNTQEGPDPIAGTASTTAPRAEGGEEFSSRPSGVDDAQNPGSRSQAALLAGLTGLLVAAVLWGIFARQSESVLLPEADSDVALQPAPLPPDEWTELRADWRAARDQLAQRREALANARAEPFAAMHAREWRDLIDQYVFDTRFQASVDQQLATVLPADVSRQAVALEVQRSIELSEAAGGRLVTLANLKSAVAGRSAVESQLQQLREAGLPEWPLPGDLVTDLFPDRSVEQVQNLGSLTVNAGLDLAAGKFELAAEEYRELAAGLSLLEHSLSERAESESEPAESKERQVAEFYRLGLEAISRYHLSRPEARSALFFAREIESLDPGRIEAAQLRRAIQSGYIALLSAERDRGNDVLANYYAGLAAEMGASRAEINAAYREAEAKGD